MAEFRYKDRLEIITASLPVLKYMYKHIQRMNYDDKCKFIEVLVQYIFAIYADLGRREGEWVKIVVKNILCKFSGRRDMILFIQNLVDTRNEIAHARCIQSTITRVDKLFASNELYTLCKELEIQDNDCTFDAAKIMSGE